MLSWLVCTVASYTVVPTATYLGATLGAKLSINIAGKIWKYVSEGVRGVITITLKKSRVYIVYHGDIIEIDPRKKYTIIRGEVHIEDSLINVDNDQSMTEWYMI